MKHFVLFSHSPRFSVPNWETQGNSKSDLCSTPASWNKGNWWGCYLGEERKMWWSLTLQTTIWGRKVCEFASMTIIWFACISSRRKIQGFFFSLPSPLNSPPPYFPFSHLFCSVLISSVRNDWPTTANSSLLGDALALGSCLPKDSGITLLKTSYFAVLKAAGLSLPQKAIMQLSLSLLSPYANLIESCLQSKRDCPLSQSVIVLVHMCSHAGGVCVCARQAELAWDDSGIK